MTHIYYFFLFTKTFSLLTKHDACWAQYVAVFSFPELKISTQCFSCKHKALCNDPSKNLLIIQDNEQKPNSFLHELVSVREDLLALPDRWWSLNMELGQTSEKPSKTSPLKCRAFTCGFYLGCKMNFVVRLFVQTCVPSLAIIWKFSFFPIMRHLK